MREFVKTAIFYGSLLLIAYWVDSFYHYLELQHNMSNPVKELDISERRPLKMQSVLIQACPDERGKLQAFVDCHTQITDMMRGEDNVR